MSSSSSALGVQLKVVPLFRSLSSLKLRLCLWIISLY
jgi:hypothetical protein